MMHTMRSTIRQVSSWVWQANAGFAGHAKRRVPLDDESGGQECFERSRERCSAQTRGGKTLRQATVDFGSEAKSRWFVCGWKLPIS